MELPHDLVTQEYIEVIGELEKENRVARVKDIAVRRGVSRSSVSIALNQLAKKELISHEQYGHVILTQQGRRLANRLEKRHQAVKSFLINILGISEGTAETDACQIEHLMSGETVTALVNFLDFLEGNPTFFSELKDGYRGTPK